MCLIDFKMLYYVQCTDTSLFEICSDPFDRHIKYIQRSVIIHLYILMAAG